MRSGFVCAIIVTLIVCAPALAYDWSYNPGDGSAENPYQISEPNHLMSIGSDPNLLDKHFILINDIIFDPNNNPSHVFDKALIAPDIDNRTWGFQGNKFTGHLAGNNHAIKNYTHVSTQTESWIGIIGYAHGATLTNISLENLNISSENGTKIGGLIGEQWDCEISHCYTTGTVQGFENVGSLIGASYDSTISQCQNAAQVSGENDAIGGLIGLQIRGTIEDCNNIGNISGDYSIGGLVGSGQYSQITNCFSLGAVHGKIGVGGIIGNQEGGQVSHSHAVGNITGTYSVGGLAGHTECTLSSTVLIRDSYTKSEVHGKSDVGGLVGYHDYGTIVNCYSISDVNGLGDVGGLIGLHDSSGPILRCYSQGTVHGNGRSGGLIGDSSGDIIDCWSSSDVDGIQDIGGLAGQHETGDIIRCASSGNVNGQSYVGGLVGDLNFDGDIMYCVSTSSVVGTEYIGGLVGEIGGTTANDRYCEVYNSYSLAYVEGHTYTGGFAGHHAYATMANCYSASVLGITGVSGSTIGGLIGKSQYSNVNDCFWDREQAGTYYSSGGVYLTTAEMKIRQPFTSVGWDFLGESDNGDNEIWRMCVDGVDYPRLSWEFAQNGDFACGDGVDIFDLQSLAEHWLLMEDDDPAAFNYACDANGDEAIDLLDFQKLAENW